jgi:hypothetical protein
MGWVYCSFICIRGSSVEMVFTASFASDERCATMARLKKVKTQVIIKRFM